MSLVGVKSGFSHGGKKLKVKHLEKEVKDI
jgi:hypothetical protein